MEDHLIQPEAWVWGRLVSHADGKSLRYGFMSRHQNPVANIVMVGGLSEFAEKYFGTIRDADANGYNCYFMDTMGQGGSGRYLSDSFKRHSLGLGRDRDDLLQFMNECVPDNAPTVMLAHSMGSLPALMVLQAVPGKIKAAVLTAPLLGFETFPAKGNEKFLAKFPFPRIFMESYIPGGGPWRPRSTPGNMLNPPEMFSSHPVLMLQHDAWMERKPELRIGSSTNGLIVHASRAIMGLREPDVVESIKTPVKIFSAGQENLVSNAAIFNMAARLSKGAGQGDHHTHLPTAKHEILQETDDIRVPVLREMDRFFRKYL